MTLLSLIDVDAVSMGIEALILLCVIGAILVLLGALVFFLWYRKRKMSGVEMIRPDAELAGSARHAQPSSPNQP
jgi:hypothetical protein